jgi:hypothetical protein
MKTLFEDSPVLEIDLFVLLDFVFEYESWKSFRYDMSFLRVIKPLNDN